MMDGTTSSTEQHVDQLLLLSNLSLPISLLHQVPTFHVVSSCSSPPDIPGVKHGSCNGTEVGHSCDFLCAFPLSPAGVGPLSNTTIFCNATGGWDIKGSYCELSFWLLGVFVAVGTAIVLGIVLGIKNAIARGGSEEEERLALDRPLLNPAAALPSTEELTDEEDEDYEEGDGEEWIEVVEEEEEEDNEDDRIPEEDEEDEEEAEEEVVVPAEGTPEAR